MARYSAILDACVLVPITLADLLLRLAEADLYRPLWSASIMDEMVAAIEQVHPDLGEGRAARRAGQMNEAFYDAEVTDFAHMVNAIHLPDPNDRHVVAAAQRGRADVIVTANLRDFPTDLLAELDIEVQSPDDFLLNQLDLEPDLTMLCLQQLAAATGNPPLTTIDVLNRLERAGAPRFSHRAGQQLWRHPTSG